MIENPYPGLRPFEARDSYVFFGRGDQIGELESNLKRNNFVAVIGSSGCGKSSLINAGLLPELVKATNQISPFSWDVVRSTPSDSPFKNLAKSINELLIKKYPKEKHDFLSIQQDLASAPLKGIADIFTGKSILENNNILVFIDQFEELFSQGGDDATSMSTKKQFLGLLADTINSDTPNLYVMIAMRSEYIARLNISKIFADRLKNALFIVPELDENELYEAIQTPAMAFGVSVESEVVAKLKKSISGNQDKLPLLQSYISLIWREKINEESKSLSLSTITELDPSKRLDSYANEVYEHGIVLGEQLPVWDDEEKNIARYIFSSICKRDVNGERVRHPLTINEIAEMTGIDAEKIKIVANILRALDVGLVKPFTPDSSMDSDPNYKLELSLDEDKLDIPHESLIRNWEILGDWIDQEASLSRIYHQISVQAAQWYFTDSPSQKKKMLLGGMALKSALDWKDKVRTVFRDLDEKEIEVILDKVSVEWLDKNCKPLSRIDLGFDDVLFSKCKSKSVINIRDIVYAFVKESKKAEVDAIRKLKVRSRAVGCIALIAVVLFFGAITLYLEKQEEIKKKDTEMYLGIASNLARSVVEDKNMHPHVRMLIGLATLNHLVLVPVEEKRKHADICKTIHQAYTDYGGFLTARGKFKSDSKKNEDWFCKLSDTAEAKEKYRDLNKEICSLVTINITLSEWSKATNRDYRSFDTICVDHLDGIHMEIINSLQLGAEIDVEKGVVKSYWEAKLIEVKVSGDVKQKSFMDRSKKVHEAWKSGDKVRLEKLAKTIDHKKLVAYMQSGYFENLALTKKPKKAQRDLPLHSEEPIKVFRTLELISIVTDVALSNEPTLSHVRRKIPERSWDKSGGDKAIANAMAPVCLCGLAYEKVDEVFNICDSAVTLSGNEDSPFQRSRGLARALRGDFDEAIKDYERHLNWIKDKMSFRRVNHDREYLIDEKERTVAAMKKIENPEEREKFSISDDVKGNIKEKCDVSAWESG